MSINGEFNSHFSYIGVIQGGVCKFLDSTGHLRNINKAHEFETLIDKVAFDKILEQQRKKKQEEDRKREEAMQKIMNSSAPKTKNKKCKKRSCFQPKSKYKRRKGKHQCNTDKVKM